MKRFSDEENKYLRGPPARGSHTLVAVELGLLPASNFSAPAYPRRIVVGPGK